MARADLKLKYFVSLFGDNATSTSTTTTSPLLLLLLLHTPALHNR